MNEIITTGDGSHTVNSALFNASYHSVHGAIEETRVVFIEAGFQYMLKKQTSSIKILEIGFGTGLNIFMTFLASKDLATMVDVVSLEPYPLAKESYERLNYHHLLTNAFQHEFLLMHAQEFDKELPLAPNFNLTKYTTGVQDFETNRTFNLVYFDAFAPNCQPELWSSQVFEKLYQKMEKGGALVTYCSKGEVKRNLKSVGFILESLPGPGRKREITRAIKLD